MLRIFKPLCSKLTQFRLVWTFIFGKLGWFIINYLTLVYRLVVIKVSIVIFFQSHVMNVWNKNLPFRECLSDMYNNKTLFVKLLITKSEAVFVDFYALGTINGKQYLTHPVLKSTHTPPSNYSIQLPCHFSIRWLPMAYYPRDRIIREPITPVQPEAVP